MAFVLERERRFPLADTYNDQATLLELNFFIVAPVAVVDATLQAAMFAASIFGDIKAGYLSYTLERDQTPFPDRFRVWVFVAGQINQDLSGTDINLLPSRHQYINNLRVQSLARRDPAALPLIIVALAGVIIQWSIALSILGLAGVLAWRIARGGLWGALGGAEDPTGSQTLILAGVLTVGAVAAILLLAPKKRRTA